jgi:hypothetical protein
VSSEKARWRNPWTLCVRAVAGVVLIFVLSAPQTFGEIGTLPRTALALAAIVAWVVAAVADMIRDRRTRHLQVEARAAGKSTLGEPYHVGLEGTNGGALLQFSDTELSLSKPIADTVRLPLAEIESIRVRATSIEIHHPEHVLKIRPTSYADRQRLEFELAYRCNDAMERGIDQTAAPPLAPSPAPAPPPDERVVTGLGSALAPPPKTSTPAPPRKSGLGVGLFPMPPSKDE